jgi:hypothetical protein
MADDAQFRISSTPSEEISGAKLHKKQRVHSRSAKEASFDSAHRREYLKGFRKRKTERKKQGAELAKHKEKLAKTEAKKQRNKQIYGDMRTLLDDWDEEHDAEETKKRERASSQTAQAEQLEFGEGAAATTVSIEPWTGEDSDEDSGGAAEADTDDYGSAGILGHASVESLLSSKAKKGAWKPNTIKIGRDGKGKAKLREQWGDKEGNVEVDAATTMSSEITYAGEGEEDDNRPDWWKKSRSGRPAVSLARQKRQKYIQGKMKTLKSKSFKAEKKMLKKMGGGSKGRGLKLLKGTSKSDRPNKKGKKGGGKKA